MMCTYACYIFCNFEYDLVYSEPISTGVKALDKYEDYAQI